MADKQLGYQCNVSAHSISSDVRLQRLSTIISHAFLLLTTRPRAIHRGRHQRVTHALSLYTKFWTVICLSVTGEQRLNFARQQVKTRSPAVTEQPRFFIPTHRFRLIFCKCHTLGFSDLCKCPKDFVIQVTLAVTTSSDEIETFVCN